MALIVLEGTDRSGKSTIAKWYELNGYEYIHMKAPPKDCTPDQYLQEMIDLISSAASKDIVLDRSHYGELIWPGIFSRAQLLDEDAIEVLREIEEAVGVERILMHDLSVDAHWQRCVDNKEPLTKAQFVKARSLYYSMADKYGFVRKTLHDFPDAKTISVIEPIKKDTIKDDNSSDEKSEQLLQSTSKAPDRTTQQIKLDRANAINEVLSKRIIKHKGQDFEDIERSIRNFLNNELGKIFNNPSNDLKGFTDKEVELLKFFCQRLSEKE